MLSLSLLFWATLAAALLSFWWKSDKIKVHALGFVHQYCKQRNLQLLDQTLVLRGLWPARDTDGRLQLRRRYCFEFASTGKDRYQGAISLLGRRLLSLDLDAHILPEDLNS
ncbi:MAG: DUF3301 domain-containing protein [Pseudohongiellaceae bacterium]